MRLVLTNRPATPAARGTSHAAGHWADRLRGRLWYVYADDAAAAADAAAADAASNDAAAADPLAQGHNVDLAPKAKSAWALVYFRVTAGVHQQAVTAITTQLSRAKMKQKLQKTI